MEVSDCMSTVMGSAIENIIRKISMGKDGAQSLLTGCSGPVFLSLLALLGLVSSGNCW